MADLKLKVLVLPFLEEMAKHANWCRKHVSDVANCTCPAEGAQAEIDAIHAAVAATESKLSACLEGQEALKAQTVRIRSVLAQCGAASFGQWAENVNTEQIAKEIVGRLSEALKDRDTAEQCLHALQEKFGAQSRDLVDALERLDGIKALRVEIVDLISDHDETLQRLLWPSGVEKP